LPAEILSLDVTGPEAAALAGIGDGNLVLRAARDLAAHYGIAPHAMLRLAKHLPVASGIGGGSSDAAAAMRALAALWDQSIDDRAMRLAERLGADVPACLVGRAAWVGGIGERIEPVAKLPALGIVLANPRRELPTASVFRARQGAFTDAPARIVLPDADALLTLLRQCRNDLTEAAIGLAPEIGAVLSRLAALPDALLARMSGSGATCFALFADRGAAARAAALLTAAESRWWVKPGVLLPDPVPLKPADQEAAAHREPHRSSLRAPRRALCPGR
jgi:4-diphosphocytidyl-2-C-methyl-D-erythritol kinase